MSTTITLRPPDDTIPAEVVADLEAVAAAVAAGLEIDPALLRRVRERAARSRQEVQERHGLLDIGVPAIRELRESA